MLGIILMSLIICLIVVTLYYENGTEEYLTICMAGVDALYCEDYAYPVNFDEFDAFIKAFM